MSTSRVLPLETRGLQKRYGHVVVVDTSLSSRGTTSQIRSASEASASFGGAIYWRSPAPFKNHGHTARPFGPAPL